MALAVQHVEGQRAEERVEVDVEKGADAGGGVERLHVEEPYLKEGFLVEVELDLARCN